MIKNRIKIAFIFTLICQVLLNTLPISSQLHGKNSHSLDFTQIAKDAIPAVVSIKVSTRQSHGLQQSYKDPFDGFQDEFFQRFFGVPKNDRFNQQQPQPAMGQASGFIVSKDGYIITNNHVIDNASEVYVTLNNGREYLATIIGHDPNTDIALLKIESDQLPYLNLGNSEQLEVGEWVIAIGNPLGLQASLTAGVVSAKGRNNLDLATIEDFIQTDAAINRGNSGGPLLDLDGNVIGVNSAIVSSMGTGGYMGIGFAIPSNIAKHVMDQILQVGHVSRGFLGIALQKVDNNLAEIFNLDSVEGALVAEVTKNSPAEKSGIKQGDIILEYNNLPVYNVATLKNAISMISPGTKVRLTILRNDKRMILPVTVGTYPTASAEISSSATKLGFDVETLTPEKAKSLNYHNEKGVIVTKVDPTGPGAWAGIKPGSLIISVNNRPVSSSEDFLSFLQETQAGKPVLLLIKQGEITRFVSIKINGN